MFDEPFVHVPPGRPQYASTAASITLNLMTPDSAHGTGERHLRSNRRHVVIVGTHSSGKSTLANSIASQVSGATVYEMGDIVRREARLRGSTHLLETARSLMEMDPLFIPKSVIEQATLSGADPALIVGPRTLTELRYLKGFAPITVGVHVSDHMRRARWLRDHATDSDTWAQREFQESRWGTPSLINMCELVVDGSRPLEERTRLLIQTIGSSR